MATTSSEDVRKAFNTAFEQIKTSLLAALGAGNLAGQAVADAVGKARERVTESSETARKNIEDLPADVESLRERLEPAELRKLLDEYTDAALKLYHRLAETGEQTWEKFLTQPQVKKNIEQLEDALHSAQGRMDEVTSEVRDRMDDVVSRMSGRTRATGTAAAGKIEKVTAEVGDKIEETRPAAPAAPKAAPKSRATNTRRSTSAAKKPTSSTNSKTSK
ncbi:hypothetical protein ABZ863_01445 [Saccharomonospora sp. NPDC046836]|uniref:hypothetical protein n=1 Tax=Saccharomonospora sp. NPDC046836 TaxID=3156921 RepID=UPI0033D2D0C9